MRYCYGNGGNKNKGIIYYTYQPLYTIAYPRLY